MKLTDFINVRPPAPKNDRFTIRKYWSAQIGQAEGRGDTADVAVGELQKAVKQALTGNYSASLVPYRGSLGIIWRTPKDAWCYQIVETKDLRETSHNLWGTSSGFETEELALRSLRHHMAQNGWDGVEESSPLILDTQDQGRFGEWARWQKAYRRLEVTGMDDAAIREQLFKEGL